MSNSNKSSYELLETENVALQAEVAKLKYQLDCLTTPLSFDSNEDDNTPPTLHIEPVKHYINSHPTVFTPYHNLTHPALLRFSRHLILNQVSPIIQNKWSKSRVLIIGAGGLGAPVALYLAAAGIGHMTLVDADVVDESNLHRQIIHNETMLDKPKVISAADQCRKINSGLSLTLIQDTFHSGNAIRLTLDHDIIVDCTDNVTARYLTSDAAVYCNRPLISAAVVGTNGQLTTYCYKNGPCYRCLNPTPPPPETVMSCADAGVIGSLVGVVGTTQALEALKVLAQIKLINQNNIKEPNEIHHNSWPKTIESNFEPLSESMIFWDGSSTSIRRATVRPRQDSCMCKMRPNDNIGPVALNHHTNDDKSNDNDVIAPESTQNNNNHCDGQDHEINNIDIISTKSMLTNEEIEALEVDLRTRTVEWACNLAPKAHKPPADGVDVSAPMEATFRLDRIEAGLMLEQIKSQVDYAKEQAAKSNEIMNPLMTKTNPYMLPPPCQLSPDVQSKLGDLLHPLLIDVRFIEQFQIVSVPSSLYCDNMTIMRTPNKLRDLLWQQYYQRYPEHCEINPLVEQFELEIQTQDGVAKIEGETKSQFNKRHKSYQLINPPPYQLTQDIMNLFNYTSQQEQECVVNLDIKEKIVVHSLKELSSVTNGNTCPSIAATANNTNVTLGVIPPPLDLNSNENNNNTQKITDNSSSSPTEKVIFSELDSLPILHTSLLCRRGRWTMMLLDWFAKYIFTTYFHNFEIDFQLKNKAMLQTLVHNITTHGDEASGDNIVIDNGNVYCKKCDSDNEGNRSPSLSPVQRPLATPPLAPLVTTSATLPHIPQPAMFSVNLKQTIPTLSATFAYMAVCCGYPPIVLSDVYGGLTALTAIYPQFPTY